MVHGPRPRSYEYTLPKKVRQLGLRAALSIRFSQGDLHVVDSLELPTHKTRHLVEVLERNCWHSALLVDGGELDRNIALSVGNLQEVDILPSIGLNVYSILLRKTLILSVGAVRMLEERLS